MWVGKPHESTTGRCATALTHAETHDPGRVAAASGSAFQMNDPNVLAVPAGFLRSTRRALTWLRQERHDPNDASADWFATDDSAARDPVPFAVPCRPMIDAIRAMPSGIRLFLIYAFLILAGIGLSLRYVVDTAIEASVSFQGVVVMALLAYTIFTTTLVLQRKEAARGLALGLASLVVPLVPLLALSQLPVEALFVAGLGVLLFRGLLRPEVRTYLNEP
jgi:hypothetical protein